MTALDPAERRRVLRSAVECAIALQPGVRSRQAAPITAAVWRVIRPVLEQRDAQITAVRDVIAAMDSTTGARFWAEQLRTALRAQHAATDDEPETLPPLAWCGASMPGIGGQPIGPCVLRNGHDGPVHQAANGTRWWLHNGVITIPAPITAEQAEAFRAQWAEHFAEHARNGTISPHSATRIAEAIEQTTTRTETS